MTEDMMRAYLWGLHERYRQTFNCYTYHLEFRNMTLVNESYGKLEGLEEAIRSFELYYSMTEGGK